MLNFALFSILKGGKKCSFHLSILIRYGGLAFEESEAKNRAEQVNSIWRRGHNNLDNGQTLIHECLPYLSEVLLTHSTYNVFQRFIALDSSEVRLTFLIKMDTF